MDATSDACDGTTTEYEELQAQKPRRILLSAILTLTLSILGRQGPSSLHEQGMHAN